MPITVLSPFSGRPVKVRDQDVGRAVRDEENRIFYVVERADGSGYYAAPTRKGSPRDEQRYDELETKTDTSTTQVKAEHAAVAPAHDATGPGRKGSKARLLIILILLLLAVAGIYIAINGTDGIPGLGTPGNNTPAEPTEPDPGTEAPGNAFQLPPLPDDPEPKLSPAALALVQQIREANAAKPTHSQYQKPVLSASEGPDHTEENLDDAKQRITDSLDEERPFTRTASGLRYRVDEDGTGDRAKAGKFVLIHYTAALYNPDAKPRIIDSSRGGKPLGFVLWSGQVIRGWDEGIAGMREAEKRTLIIPTELAGSTAGNTTLAELPDANLLCEIELVEVRPGVSHIVDKVGAGKLAYPGQTVEIDYTATIKGEPRPFDNSRSHGTPLQITIGSGEVIPGLELGVTGMAVGETRTLQIPSYLAYGSRGAGSLIPPDSDLTYTITLLRILDE